ncbi:MAG: L-seryl-tRNA(Sec) selenium transferase [Lachnospiraceae bacterium]
MKNLYRKIPKVDLMLEMPGIQKLVGIFGKKTVTESVRKETELLRGFLKESEQMLRQMSVSAEEKEEKEQELTAQFEEKLADFENAVEKQLVKEDRIGFCRVLNATGTILHTNLGRSPISREHAEKIADLVSGYSNLEYDLEAGCRGERYSHFEKLICQVTGAESAMAVNNNAGAVLLTLSALGCGKEVIVSRGEQIEIGGKFRVPDVIRQGGAILCEVGTTNKTHLSDYEEAINENTGILLKVHTSNYRIVGFSDSVSTHDLAELGKRKQIPVVEDLGSGILIDLRRYGIANEPTVQETIAAGADVVCFSGDKLLGGPQAGIIVGKKEYIDRIKKHPLTRALRIDKFTAAALELVWKEYYLCNPVQLMEKIPVLKMFASTEVEQRKRAEKIVSAWRADAGDMYELQIRPMEAQMGGGTLPTYQFKGAGIVILPRDENALTAEQLEETFRRLPVPIIGRIQNGCFELHMQTVFDEDLPLFIEEGKTCLSRENGFV